MLRLGVAAQSGSLDASSLSTSSHRSSRRASFAFSRSWYHFAPPQTTKPTAAKTTPRIICKEPPAVSAPPPELPGLAAPNISADGAGELATGAGVCDATGAFVNTGAGVGTTSEIVSSASSDADTWTAFDASMASKEG